MRSETQANAAGGARPTSKAAHAAAIAERIDLPNLESVRARASLSRAPALARDDSAGVTSREIGYSEGPLGTSDALALPPAGQDRRRRHGGHLPRPRPAAGSHGRAQGAAQR